MLLRSSLRLVVLCYQAVTGSGPTRMKDPPNGFPKPTSCAKRLILKFAIDVFDVKTVCELKLRGWLKRKKT